MNIGSKVFKDVRPFFDPDALTSVTEGSMCGRFDAAVGVGGRLFRHFAWLVLRWLWEGNVLEGAECRFPFFGGTEIFGHAQVQVGGN